MTLKEHDKTCQNSVAGPTCVPAEGALLGTINRQHGFTLIELLVVVAIIVVLIAILMPSLAAARSTVNRTVCLSNLRQVGMAFQQYVADSENAGTIPSVTQNAAAPGSRTWYWAVTTYLLSNVTGTSADLDRIQKYMYCPAMSPRIATVTPQFRTGRHFAMNWALGPSNNSPYWRKYTSINSQSTCILLSECGYSTSGPVAQLDSYWMASAAGTPYTGGAHGKSGNIAWLDGHASSETNILKFTFYPFRSLDPQDVWSPGYNPLQP